MAAVSVGDANVAFPYQVLAEERVVNYNIDGQDIAVFYKPGTLSALDASVIAESRDVGATGVFDPVVDDTKLTFGFAGDSGSIVDEETGRPGDREHVEYPRRCRGRPTGGHGTRPPGPPGPLLVRLGGVPPDTIVYRGVTE